MNLIHLDDRDGVRALPNIDSPDQAAASALGALESRCEWEPGDLSPFDTALVSMTKYQHRDKEDSWMSAVPMCKKAGLRTWIFQEAEADWFNHRPDNEQLDFVRNCRQADGMLCHTHDSARFYHALLEIKAVAVPTLMPLSKLPAPRGENTGHILVLGTPDERARGWWALTHCKAQGLTRNLCVVSRDGADDGSRVKPVMEALGLQGTTHGYLPLQKYAELFRTASLAITAMRAQAAARDRILARWYSVPLISCWDANIEKFPMTTRRTTDPMDLRSHDWHPTHSAALYHHLLTKGGLL